jgi:hypothetical protein
MSSQTTGPAVKREFLDYSVLFSKTTVLHKWMLRIRRDEFSAVLPSTAKVESVDSSNNHKAHALRVQEAANGIQHLPMNFSGVGAVARTSKLCAALPLSARDLLGSAQRLFGAFAFGDIDNRADELHQITASSLNG